MQSITSDATSMPMPWDEGFLGVGDGHLVWFAQYGRPDAPAAVVLHGGPGSGCRPAMAQWFDLRRWRVILVDQRGSGRSTADDPLFRNTTPDLVMDLEKLRRALAIERWAVVGGSWGACLGLLYAGHAPDAVTRLVLRGVFLAGREEVDGFFHGLKSRAPAAWKRLTADWSGMQQRNVFQTLTALLQNGTLMEQQDAALRWGRYEDELMQAMRGMQAGPACGEPPLSTWLAKYRLQAHYLAAGCFTSRQALSHAAARLASVPVTIVHGSRDWICRPNNAVQVGRWLPHSRLQWVPNGTHVASDPLIHAALAAAIECCLDGPA